MLEKSQPAPMFRALNQNNQLIGLYDYAGDKNIVLYFYPKDDTPGCTIEANDFTALAEQFAALDTVVIGVSKDTCACHADFINKYNLKVELLADTQGDMCVNYGVWRERIKNGVKGMHIMRSTFIIDKNGILQDVAYGVNHEGHAQETLDKLKNPQPEVEEAAVEETEAAPPEVQAEAAVEETAEAAPAEETVAEAETATE